MFQLENLDNIPHKPGVYLFLGRKDEVLYIGKAKDLKKRVSQYFAANSVWKLDMLSKAIKVEYLLAQTESEALYLEDNLIKRHQPPYNSLLKWDNSYVFIKITKESYPQIFITRRKVNDGATYIGPKHMRRDLKELLQFFRQFLQRRWCKSTQFKQGVLCSDYFFWLCKGWCIMNIQWSNQWSKQQLVDVAAKQWLVLDREQSYYREEYQRLVNVVTDFFYGNSKPLVQHIHQVLQDAIQQEHFEYCARLKSILSHVNVFVEQQRVVMTQPLSGVLRLIRETWEYYVIVICVLYEGKVIDVIRNKQKKQEIWLDELQMWLAREFDVDSSRQKVFELSDGVFVLNGDLCKIKAISRKECVTLCEGFMEAYIAGSSFETDSVMNSLHQELQDRYQLKSYPYKIECVDISHFSWGRASGGLSCQVWWVPYKAGYRKYKIADKKIAGDDYASLRFVLQKRFGSMQQNKDYPDLMIIDGWIGQLHTIQQLIRDHPERNDYREQVQIAALGKWSARKRSQKSKGEREQLFVLENGWRIREYELRYDQIDMILTWARDEAHRFANAYRTKQMWMEWR